MRGPSNSQKKMPCQVPSASWPSRSGISDLRPGKHGAHVRRRVLLAGLDVLPAPVVADEPLHGALEVARDSRVGVLVDRHAGGRVRHVDEHGLAAARRAGRLRTWSVMSSTCVRLDVLMVTSRTGLS